MNDEGYRREHWQLPLDHCPIILVVDGRDVGKVFNSFTGAYLGNDLELSCKFKIYFYEFIV